MPKLNALRTTSAITLFSRSGPQRQLAICRIQKNTPGKDLAPMKKWYWKPRCILRPKTNCSTKKKKKKKKKKGIK